MCQIVKMMRQIIKISLIKRYILVLTHWFFGMVELHVKVYIMYLRQKGILCKQFAINKDMTNTNMDKIGIDIIVLNLVEEIPNKDNIHITNI